MLYLSQSFLLIEILYCLISNAIGYWLMEFRLIVARTSGIKLTLNYVIINMYWLIGEALLV